MIECIKGLPSTVCNIVEYVSCPALEYLVKQLCMNKFVVSPNYSYTVDKLKVLKEDQSIVNAIPLQGERWMLVVDVDKIGVSDSIKALELTVNTAITLYVTHNYNNYKQMINSKIFKAESSTNYAISLYLTRLTDAAIDEIYNYYLMGKPKNFDSKLMVYVKKNYKYNPDLVCSLFDKVKNGFSKKKEKDVIELVGIGGNTPQALTISLLTTSTKTDKGKKQFLKKNLALFEDLSVKYSYDTTYAYMISTLRGIIDIKQLQISGKYFEFHQEIPDTFPENRKKRILRLHRFEYVILNKISLRRALVLFKCMQSNDFDRKQVILEGIYKYVNSLG